MSARARRRIPPKHPALLAHVEERSKTAQDRMADAITTFAGSMSFVWVHVAWFGLWVAMSLGLFGKSLQFDRFPFGLLTMIVSLEAIFLSTFVMISQNRADSRRQALADHQWMLVQEEGKQNEELLRISKEILDLTKAIHQLSGARGES